MDNVIETKSFDFSVKSLKFARMLRKEIGEYELASQFLCSSTSIGANVSEAQYAQSRRDFISKMAIARKEANEAKYWLKLLVAAEVINEDVAKDLISDVSEIIRILTSIIKTASDNV